MNNDMTARLAELVNHLLDKIERLEADNDKLRSQLRIADESIEWWSNADAVG